MHLLTEALAGMAGADPTIVIPSLRITLDKGNEIKGELEDFEEGEIQVTRDGGFTEIELDIDGHKEKARVPTAWLGAAPAVLNAFIINISARQRSLALHASELSRAMIVEEQPEHVRGKPFPPHLPLLEQRAFRCAAELLDGAVGPGQRRAAVAGVAPHTGSGKGGLG